MGCKGSKSKKHAIEIGVDLARVDLFKIYTLETIIAYGGMGEVWKARQRYLPANEVAIKFVEVSKGDQLAKENVLREIEILRKLNHPNLIFLLDVFEGRGSYAMVMDHFAGGDLLTRIADRNYFPEYPAKHLMLQIMGGVEFLHSMGIVHRDIKPDNILCSNDPQFFPFRIVISDFGISGFANHGESMEIHCGSEEYAAPEILFGNSRYGNSVDLWSCGVTAYAIVCGVLPFMSREGVIERERIATCCYNYKNVHNKSVSLQFSKFVASLLQLVPENRPSANIAKLDPWRKV